ncbi:hypothetical protein [Streptomyces europaeiscabiei]|uniref:hypothetical protein n=1 Tax=Streptomyces europaeiscabiei TaxID=146819 RepID=UPI0038F5E7D8
MDLGVEFAQPCGELFDAGRDLFGLPGQFPLAGVDLVQERPDPVVAGHQPPGYDIAHR